MRQCNLFFSDSINEKLPWFHLHLNIAKEEKRLCLITALRRYFACSLGDYFWQNCFTFTAGNEVRLVRNMRFGNTRCVPNFPPSATQTFQ